MVLFPFLVALLGSGAGCSAKLDGELVIDGSSFKPTGCRSGEAFGFVGVELAISDGRKVRLAARADGQADAFLFQTSGNAITLGACGPLTVEQQNSTINGITNVKGSATPDCQAGSHSLKGRVTFENCH
jgi:hypothetical protein